ncbi:hypothetical protein Ddc_11776 [Ditylenchus destructor]|nr:hypothetical protein Ddc_11776 [Ditylenchus destructor]
MFLPDEILLEILRFLNWNELGIISVTTRQNYRIVRKYFPHRILWNKILFLEWENLETKLTLFDVTSNEYFIPTTRQWQKNGQQVQVLNIENLEPPYGLCEMGPFLNETMRVPKVFLYVPNRLCAIQDMDDLLSLTHLWSDRELTLYIDYIDPVIHLNSWMDQLLTTPNLLQCQQLILDYSENMVPFYPHPNIYKLRLLKIMCWFIDDKNILELIESKRMYPDSNTVFVLWYTEGKLSTLVEVIRTSFLASSMELQFRIIAAVNANDDIPISEFCLINSNIKEMLKLKKLAPHEYECYYDDELNNSMTMWSLERMAASNT